MKRLTLTILFLSFAGVIIAQQAELGVSQKISAYDSIRERYIKSFPDEFGIWPLLKQRRLEFTLEDAPQRAKRLFYRSNKPYSLGVGLYIFEVVLELTVAVPLGERNKRIYGDSESQDLQLNLFAKKWGFEFYRQKYEGFYVRDPGVNIPSGTAYPQRPDIVTRNAGITGHYVFNNKKFSFRSTYNFADRQLHSAGSIMAFGSISRFKTEGDSAILGNNYSNYFGTDARIMEFKSTTLSVTPGYTHSFIYKGFFLNAAAGIGPAYNWLYFRSQDGSEEHRIRFTPFYVARVSVGYDSNRFFCGLSYVAQGNRVQFDTIHLVSSTGTFKVLFGFRFKEVGFLKHRIAEVPQLLGIGD